MVHTKNARNCCIINCLCGEIETMSLYGQHMRGPNCPLYMAWVTNRASICVKFLGGSRSHRPPFSPYHLWQVPILKIHNEVPPKKIFVAFKPHWASNAFFSVGGMVNYPRRSTLVLRHRKSVHALPTYAYAPCCTLCHGTLHLYALLPVPGVDLWHC